MTCLAWAHAVLVVHSPSRRTLAHQLAKPEEFARVIGVVAKEPVEREGFREGEVILDFPVKLEGANWRGPWQKAAGSVQVRLRTDGSAPALAYGDRWLISGLVRDQRGTPSIWRFRQPYRMEMDLRGSRCLSRGHGSKLLQYCLKARGRSAGVLRRGIEDFPAHAGLLHALILGYRQDLPADLRTTFAVTGTLHIFAISGLHVGVMATLLLAVVRIAGVSRPYWVLALAPLLFLYTVTTGMASSAIRAFVMAVLFWTAPLFGRKPDAPSAFAWAAVIILVAAPAQISDPGFIFSFAVVAGLLALVSPLLLPVRPHLRPEPWQVQQEAAWRRGIRWATAGLASLMAVSAAAWLTSTPLTARFFNLVSPVALLGNLLVVPMSFLILLTGCLSLLLGSSFAVIAEIFNHGNRLLIDFLLWGIGGCSRLPHAFSYVAAPSVGAMAIWYVAVLALVRGRSLRVRIVVPVVAAGLLAIPNHLRGQRRVTADILETFDGECVFLNLPGPDDVLIGGGPEFGADRVLRYLRRQGVDRLGVLLLTHADARHVGAAASILEHVEVGELWCSAYQGQSAVYDRLLDQARERGIPIRALTRGDRGVWPGEVEWRVLHPPADLPQRGRSRDASLVLRLSRGATSMLVMGGASGNVENDLLAGQENLVSPILVVGEGDDPDVCGTAWLAAVRPRWVILSNGARDRGRVEVRGLGDRLAGCGAVVLKTNRDGPLRVAFSDAGRERLDTRLRVAPLESARARGAPPE